MSRFHKLFNNFSSGEFSPTALGRVDTKEYMTASRLMYNWISKRNHSGKRNGTHFVADLTGMFRPGLIPFIQSANSGYIIAIDPTKAQTAGTGNFIKVFRPDGVPQTVDATQFIADAPNYSVIPLNLDPNKYVYVQLGDRLIICHASGRMIPFMITLIPSGDFVVELYQTASVTNEIFDPNLVLKRPYRNVNVSSLRIRNSAVSGAITLRSSAPFFDVGQIGSIIKLTHSGTTTGAAIITGFTDDQNVSASVTEFFSISGPTTEWEESSWSDYRGWPRSIVSFEQRLAFGGNATEPDTIWGSLTGNVFHLMQRKFVQDQDSATDVSGINYFGNDVATDPFTFALAATEVNKINWMQANNNLNVGTTSTEYVGNGGQSILSNESVNFRPQTNYGSSENRAITYGNEILYLSRNAKKLRNFKYSDNNGSNISNDLSFFADHMYKTGDVYTGGGVGGDESGFVDMSFEKSNDIIWMLNKNRSLVSFSYQLDNPTVAWAKHTISKQVAIWGLTTIPSSIGDDTLYIVVERVIDGNTEYYLEALYNNYDQDTLEDIGVYAGEQPVFVDSSTTRTSPFGGIQTLTALNYLEGEDVTVTVQGRLEGIFTVTGGEVDLGRIVAEDEIIILGLPYRGDLVGAPLQAGGNFGPGIADIKRIDTAQIKFYKTYDCKVTSYGAKFHEDLNFGDDLFSGLKQVKIDADPEREHSLHFYSDQPYPCTILYSMQRGKADD